MNDYIAKLSFNFIGKILGSDTIVVQGDNLVTSKKDTILENDSAPDFRSFATFERKFLGGILTYGKCEQVSHEQKMKILVI